MHRVLCRPAPEPLPLKPKKNPERTPQRRKTHVRHDRRDVAILLGPGRNELAEAVAPEILVDGDADEDAASCRFVAVDGVGGGNGGESGDLDTGAGPANDHNRLYLENSVSARGERAKVYRA